MDVTDKKGHGGEVRLLVGECLIPVDGDSVTTLSRLTAVFLLVAGLVLPATVVLAQDYPLNLGDLVVDGITSDGSAGDLVVTGGEEITMSGGGFAPGAVIVLTIESDPVKVGETEADGRGDFRTTVTIPADLADGRHTLKATGDSPDGGTLVLAAQVRLSVASDTGDELATTGTGAAVLLSLAGLLLVGGIGVLAVTRRRPESRSV